MYKYIHDPETGGLLLTDETTNSPLSSKEPRPVYAPELDILGINKYWKYEKQDDVPYMWAEKNVYVYRGVPIFSITGGSLYEPPVVKPYFIPDENGEPSSQLVFVKGKKLQKIDLDAMVEKNHMMINVIEQTTVKKIYDYYRKMEKEVDCFHVAFSGGKDSIVLLELVRRALPQSSFIVVFGDTKMEFPDTYRLVDQIEEDCNKQKIPFYRASSHLEPEESWRLFGPPSRHLRWCCFVHKSTPQTLKIREILEKKNFVGVDFVGIRSFESATRAEYEEENYGVKQKGQYSHNSILNWTSAEIWLYIYRRNLLINEAYKKGIARVGCLFCPMGSGKSDSFRYICYKDEIERFTNLIRETISDDNIESYISNGGWAARRNGRDLKNNERRYREDIVKDRLVITVSKHTTDWAEWIKTLGVLNFDYNIEVSSDHYSVGIPASINKSTEGRLFKQVFRKSSYCIGCGVCETNCRNNAISFKNGLHISGCIHCLECHAVDEGCLVYFSTKPPTKETPEIEGKRMSLNTLSDHAPKPEWLRGFFTQGKDFFSRNTLGPVQVTKFKRFLSDAGLIKKTDITPFFDLITRIGWEGKNAWALILVQLANNNPQIRWYSQNIPIGIKTSRDLIEQQLEVTGVSKKDSRSIVKAFGRLEETPLGKELKFAMTERNDKGEIIFLSRGKSPHLDPRIVLYTLYRYAESSGDYHQFNLRHLTESNTDGEGISPALLFGMTSDDLEETIRGLAVTYSNYISAGFTHDLDKISLRSSIKSEQVLNLF